MVTLLSDNQSDPIERLNRVYYRDRGVIAGGVNYGENVTWTPDIAAFAHVVDNVQGNHADYGTGKVTITDSALAATVHVTVADGAVGTPSYTFTSDTDTGFYRVSAGRIAVAANGNKVCEFANPSGSLVGVGIGIQPTVALHVSYTQTGGFVAILKQAGTSSGDQGLQVVCGDTHAASAALEVDYNVSTVGFRVFCDGGVVVGSSASPGANTLQVVTAIGVNAAPSSNGSYMTNGLLLNQAGNDNEILACQSSDVAHGITDYGATTTYLNVQKMHPTAGGFIAQGFSSNVLTLGLYASATNSDSTHSTAAVGHIYMVARQKSGTGVGACSANANMVVIADNGSARWLVDKEGDMYLDATSNPSAWDDDEDVALLEAFRLTTMSETPSNFKRLFADSLEEHAQILHRTGVLTLNEDGHHFVSFKGLQGLLIDSIRQLYARLQETRSEVADLRRAALLEGGHDA